MLRFLGVLALSVTVTSCQTTLPEPDSAPAPRLAMEPSEVEILLGSLTKRLCSSVLVSGRPKEHVFAHELKAPTVSQITFTIDDDLVTGSILGETVAVVHREGIGCTLVKNTVVETMWDQFDPAAYPDVVTPDAPWPIGDRVTLPQSVPGIDLAAVNRAINESFVDLVPDQNISTRAALVIYKGRIIAEQYGQGFHAGMPQLGWSMTKTVTNVLTGMLVGDGKLAVSAPAPVPRWRSPEDPRSAITLNNLLQMSSGLEFSEVYTAGTMSDVILMLFANGDTGGFAAAKPLVHEPDTKWSYSSGTTNIISMIQRDLFDDQQAYFNFPRARLFNPLGMASAVIEPDATGTFVGSSYMYATPRDWAKIGLLLLQDGVWNGERLLPKGWVRYSLTPANAAPKGGYGAQIWLNAGNPGDPASVPTEGIPASTYYLSGFEGQNVVVMPEQDLIVVRMGLTTGGPRPVWNLSRSVLAALKH